MRFQNYLIEEDKKFISKADVKKFDSSWKSKLKPFGLTNFKSSIHFDERINHKRNVPPITMDELNLLMNEFIKKMGSQFKQDVEKVRNHTLKPRGKNKKELNFNELEFTISSASNGVNLTIVLKQDNKKKGTAMLLPQTVIRKKKGYFNKKGEQYMVERRELFNGELIKEEII